MAATLTPQPVTSVPTRATGTNWTRIAALGGVAYFILVVIAFIAPGGTPPDVNASVATITKFYVQHHTGLVIADFCTALSGAGLLLFAAALWRWVRRADPSGVLAVAVALGFAAGAAVAISGAAGDAALTVFAAKLGNGAVVRAFFDYQRLSFAFVWFPAAVSIGLTSLAALGSGLLPRWLAWAGFLTVLVMLLGTFSAFADTQNVLVVLNFIGFILFSLWTLATSIVIYLRAPRVAEGLSV